MPDFIVARTAPGRDLELGASAYAGVFSTEREAMEFAAALEEAQPGVIASVLPVYPPAEILAVPPA